MAMRTTSLQHAALRCVIEVASTGKQHRRQIVEYITHLLPARACVIACNGRIRAGVLDDFHASRQSSRRSSGHHIVRSKRPAISTSSCSIRPTFWSAKLSRMQELRHPVRGLVPFPLLVLGRGNLSIFICSHAPAPSARQRHVELCSEKCHLVLRHGTSISCLRVMYQPHFPPSWRSEGLVPCVLLWRASVIFWRQARDSTPAYVKRCLQCDWSGSYRERLGPASSRVWPDNDAYLRPSLRKGPAIHRREG